MSTGKKYEKTLELLHQLDAAEEQDGLFSCFAVTRRGELVYFDNLGNPFGVGVEGTALVKTKPLSLPTQNMTVITTKEAYRRATETNEWQQFANLVTSQFAARNRGKGKINWFVPLLVVVLAGFGIWFFLGRTPPEPEISVDLKKIKIINTGSYRPIAEPSISYSVFRDFLKEMNSPALPEAEIMYKACVAEGCDPAVALAFFEHESSGGRAGVAVETKSIGNIRCTSGYKCYTTQGNGSFRSYDSWAEGTRDWAKLLKYYRDTWHLATVDQIIPVYAPNSDNNNEAVYIAGVKKRVDDLRARELALKP